MNEALESLINRAKRSVPSGRKIDACELLDLLENLARNEQRMIESYGSVNEPAMNRQSAYLDVMHRIASLL